MKVVIAIDSLKGSLSSMEAGNAIKEGILKAKAAEVIVKPLADGGEGTTDALIEGLNGERIDVEVCGPLGKKVKAYYGYLKETGTAVIEMAAAAGITLEKEKKPLQATTYGVGEMIKDALERGCRDFIVGIGGSATNDGGIGMLEALGYEFLQQDGQPAGAGAQALGKIAGISDRNRHPALKECKFRVACDVNNPLCGTNGATYIYGPQKGVSEEQKALLDQDMKQYAQAVKQYNGTDYSDYPGAGAAGGVGFAFLSFLNGKLESGIELILDAVKLEAAMPGADYVITGEGRLDHQTAMGKAPVGVAKIGKKHGAKVIALAGSVTKDAGKCNEEGIDGYFSILSSVVTLEEALEAETARYNITLTAEQLFRLL